jgi:hypothetical protein
LTGPLFDGLGKLAQTLDLHPLGAVLVVPSSLLMRRPPFVAPLSPTPWCCRESSALCSRLKISAARTGKNQMQRQSLELRKRNSFVVALPILN